MVGGWWRRWVSIRFLRMKRRKRRELVKPLVRFHGPSGSHCNFEWNKLFGDMFRCTAPSVTDQLPFGDLHHGSSCSDGACAAHNLLGGTLTRPSNVRTGMIVGNTNVQQACRRMRSCRSHTTTWSMGKFGQLSEDKPSDLGTSLLTAYYSRRDSKNQKCGFSTSHQPKLLDADIQAQFTASGAIDSYHDTLAITAGMSNCHASFFPSFLPCFLPSFRGMKPLNTRNERIGSPPSPQGGNAAMQQCIVAHHAFLRRGGVFFFFFQLWCGNLRLQQ